MTVTALDRQTTAPPGPVRARHAVSIKRDPASTPGRLTDRDAAWPDLARRIVRRALADWGQPDLSDNAQLLASELLTNALSHGAGPRISFTVYLTEHRVGIEVRDGSPARPVLCHAAPEDESGRGLILVDALADAWGVSPDGMTTWCA